MEELKMLVDMVAHLPQMALWVALGFWAYKVIVIGSIYGVIRFVVDRAHSYLMTPKHEKQVIDVEYRFSGLIMGSYVPLVSQISRLIGKGRKGTQIFPSYIYSEDIDWLREAIDEKIERDAQKTEKVKS